MKHEITRLSPHQNAKVFAVVTAVSSLVVILPLGILGNLLSPAGQGWEFGALLAMPVAYLIVGYLMTWVFAKVYNAIAARLGGLEYETGESR